MAGDAGRGAALAVPGDLTISSFGWLEMPSLLGESELWYDRLEGGRRARTQFYSPHFSATPGSPRMRCLPMTDAARNQ